jgi:nicotinamide mononucleotide transporter
MTLSPWEALAVALAIAYLALAIRRNRWCWPAGIASALVYLALFWQARLYMEAVLQAFYALVGAYGWREWTRPQRERPIVSWPLPTHARVLAAVVALAAANGALLAAFTAAALPYVDSLVAWASVATTWMVARKVLENWHWWLVIDGACVAIYASRGLWLTAALFVAYLGMIVVGWRAWRRAYAAAAAGAAA